MTPYYEHEGIILYCGDMREIVPQLDQKFDAVITDPPYGETSLAWDRWPDGWPALVAPLARSMWCFGSMRMFWNQRDEFSDWKLAQDIVWEKHNGSGARKDRFRRIHELALQFYQGEWEDLYRDTPVTMDAKKISVKRRQKPQHWSEIGESSFASEEGGARLQRSIIACRSCHGHAVNETQKPEGIVEPLIHYSVPPGGVALDCFAGAGTTLAVARRMGRRAVGIEGRESQCGEIVKRLSQRDLALV